MTWNDVNAVILRVLWRWWIVLGVVIIVAGAAFFGLSSGSDRYESTSLMVVGPNTDMDPSEVLRVADLLNRNMVMSTYADVMSSPKVVASGMVDTDPERSDWSQFEVRVVQEPDSNVLRMIVEGPDQETTAGLAANVMSNGQATMGDLFPIYSITPLDAGAPQAYAISLPWMRTMGIAVVIGLGLGVLLALWFDSLLQYRQNSLGLISRAGGVGATSGADSQAAFTRR